MKSDIWVKTVVPVIGAFATAFGHDEAMSWRELLNSALGN